MSVQGGPKIISDSSLVLDIDIASRASFASGSTIVYNLSPIPTATGSVINGPVYSADGKGSIQFDGSDDYIRINNFVGLPTGSSPRTINIWFNPVSASWQGDVNNLFFYGSGNNSQSFGVDFGARYPLMEVYTWGGGNSDFGWTSSFNRSGWQNLTITYNGSNTLKIYENGNFVTSKTNLNTTNTFNSDVWIGSINPSIAANYFDGKFSNIQIYNKELNSDEVLRTYGSQKGRFSSPKLGYEGRHQAGTLTISPANTSGSITVTDAYTGSFLVYFGYADSNQITASSATDSRGNTWTNIVSQFQNSVPAMMTIFVGEIKTPLQANDKITLFYSSSARSEPYIISKVSATRFTSGSFTQFYGGDSTFTLNMDAVRVPNYQLGYIFIRSSGGSGPEAIDVNTLDTTGPYLKIVERKIPNPSPLTASLTVRSVGLHTHQFGFANFV